MSLLVSFLLLFVLDLHISYFLLKFVHLILQLPSLPLQVAYFIFHVFLLLLGLQCLPHPECDGTLVQSLVGLNGLGKYGCTDRI